MTLPLDEIVQGDCLDVMRGFPDASVDLIATDPPYFKVKNAEWDRQWDTPAAFLAWLGTVADEWRRILKPNGSLYCFASPEMAARVECLLAERFRVLNSITWSKPGQSYAEKYGPENFRRYVHMSERIIFCEHYGADGVALGVSGWGSKCAELRGFVFEPLRAYLDGERQRAGWTVADINRAWQARQGNNGGMPWHWFGRSQWQLPTPEHYQWLRVLFNAEQGEHLRREYEHLRREYEHLRRPFNATADTPYTDVWTFKTVPNFPGKHICEKPPDLMAHIVRTSSRPGDVVLDCFAGSGVTLDVAHVLGRRFVGIERAPHWAEAARRRVATLLPLFPEARP